MSHGWAADAPDGFAGPQLELFQALLPSLRMVLELKALACVSAEVLAACVGREPARRILAGAIRRGGTSLIEAAIFLGDLRGSSALAERLPGEATIALLNGYFDRVVPAVLDEVLKFIGDGVPAILRVDGAPGPAVERALAAARRAPAALKAGPVATPAGDFRLRMGVARLRGGWESGHADRLSRRPPSCRRSRRNPRWRNVPPAP